MNTILLWVVLSSAAVLSTKPMSRQHPAVLAQPHQRFSKTLPTDTGIDDPSLLLELTAAMYRAGSSLPGALEHLERVAGQELKPALKGISSGLAMGVEWNAAWKGAARLGEPPALAVIEQSLRFVAYTGAPAADLVEAEAARIRRERRQALQTKAAALGVQLVIPLGLCALPAFILWAVIPIVIAVMPMP